MIDFGEVVIFGGEPEDGNGIDAFARKFLCAGGGSDRFVETVGRPGEEAYLLAGYDGDGAFCEAIEIARDFFIEVRAAGEALILFAQDFDDALADLWVKFDFLGRGGDSGKGGRVREIARDFRKIFEKR